MRSERPVQRLDLNLLAVFDALLREASVTRAAAQLELTQSAMSHALSRLREFFGDPLFVKTATGMTPTPKASALSDSVMETMETVRDRLLTQASFDPAQVRRTISLLMTDLGEMVFLPPLLAKLKLQAPHCALRTLQTSQQQVEATLAAGDADLALGSMRWSSDGLYQQLLFSHPYIGIVSRKNRKVRGRFTVQQLTDMPHVVVTLTGKNETAYDAALDDLGIKRRIAIATPHFLTVPLLLDQHPEFVATVPLTLGQLFSRYGVVKMIGLPVAVPPITLYQYWHPRFHHDRYGIWLRKLVKESFMALPEFLERHHGNQRPPPVRRAKSKPRPAGRPSAVQRRKTL